MKQFKEHIVYKIVTLFLVFTLIVPSFVKLAHAFEDHEHEVCETPQKLHFHDFEIDCEFYKFKLNKQFLSTYVLEESIATSINSELLDSEYYHYNYNLPLYKYLRGPPTLV
ncbi:hypothetical protein U0L90_08850 [Flavobacteriaceae sp. LMIT009]